MSTLDQASVANPKVPGTLMPSRSQELQIHHTNSHASLMDGVYRYQRHVYDLTRKYYLLGRDRLLAGLDVPLEGTVLELGCGTGRNIVLAARRYPAARFFGLDISAAMLETAAANLAHESIADRARLAQGDATDFDALGLFGRQRFDRVFISYALSMIPGWEKAIDLALQSLAPGGSLHVVDFGSQERLPRWFRGALRVWLARFHVSPRDHLRTELAQQAGALGMTLEFAPLYRGYAVHAVVCKPARRALFVPPHPASASLEAGRGVHEYQSSRQSNTLANADTKPCGL